MVTNRDLLVEILRHDTFLSGEVSTDFFERTAVIESSTPGTPDATCCSQRPWPWPSATGCVDASSRASRSGWRNVVSQPQRTVLATGDTEHVVEWHGGRDGYASTDANVRVLSASPSEVVLEVDHISVRFQVAVGPGDAVAVDGPVGSAQLRAVPRFVDPADVVAQGIVAGADAGHGHRAYPSRTAPRSPPASRCWCSRR